MEDKKYTLVPFDESKLEDFNKELSELCLKYTAKIVAIPQIENGKIVAGLTVFGLQEVKDEDEGDSTQAD